MAVKTITITTHAYEALKGLKAPHESFTETILRVAQKKSLKEFAGALSPESANRLEQTIKNIHKRHTEQYRQRIKRIAKELGGIRGSP